MSIEHHKKPQNLELCALINWMFSILTRSSHFKRSNRCRVTLKKEKKISLESIYY
jgi:hypothetical protein